MMVIGPRLGTLVGTLGRCQCVPYGHTLCYALAVKYFAWDDAKNAKLRAERGIGFEDIVFHIVRGYLLDIRR